MKIWKLAEYSANRDYDLQKIWRKNKQDYFFDDTPGEIRALHERFDNSWVYREVTSIPVSQPCVYFLFLPKDSYKIGETAVGSLHDRQSKAQTYFFDAVVLEGIQLCESKSVAKKIEQTGLDYFEGIEKPRREVLTDHRGLVECYIMEYCLSQEASQIIMDNGKREKDQLFRKSKDKMRTSEPDSQHTGDFQ